VVGYPEDVDLAGGVLDNEEDVQPGQDDRVEVEQVAGQDPVRQGAEELRPVVPDCRGDGSIPAEVRIFPDPGRAAQPDQRMVDDPADPGPGSRTEGNDAGALLSTGAAIWLTNIIAFAVWYWQFDRGGPAAHARRALPDFQSVQMQNPDLAHPEWEPQFVDYLYLSFTNATAFSPTDVMPLSRWAKLTMLGQSLVSLVTLALVIARAVNILK
jgi:hypothetical protein